MVKAVFKLEQFAVADTTVSVRSSFFSGTSSYSVKNSLFGKQIEWYMISLPNVSNPTATNSTRQGWQTESPNDWSDSPTAQPNLLYRYRFGFGRDNRELPELNLGNAGHRWGNLDDNSGVILYQRVFLLSDTTSIRSFRIQGESRVDQFVTSIQNDLTHMRHTEEVTGDATVSQFPFVLIAVPEPFSKKNPVDTDVYIRLSNFATTLASGTISMVIDGIERTPLHITPFVGGLGGFDVVWLNDMEFDYDAEVRVKVEFSDTDSPANNFLIRYPFYTVPDLARPRIRNLVPRDGALGVSVQPILQFELVDFEVGVDLETLKLYVNGKQVLNGVDGVITYTPLLTSDGYTVSYVPYQPWLYGDLIPVAIFVKDLSIHENELFFTYSFTTLDSTPPIIVNTSPRSCSVDVPTGTDVSVTIVDGGHGMEEGSIIFTIDEKDPDKVYKLPVVYRED